MPRNLILTLDPGSESIKSLIFEEKKGRLNLLLKEETESAGIKNGQIVDGERFCFVLRNFFDEISKKIKSKIEICLAALNGPHLFSTSSKGSISILRPDQTISKEDIERVIEEAKRINISLNKRVLDFFPFYFQINGDEKVKNPLELKGMKLDVEGLVVGCFSPYFKNLKDSLFKTGMEEVTIIPGFLANSQSVLLGKEKEIGCCFLDLGSQTTSFSVFRDENLIYFSSLSRGTEEIKKEIATRLKIDFELAQRIQLEYSNFSSKGRNLVEKIELDGEIVNLNLRLISKIIQQKITGIFSQVFKELKKIGQEKLPGGVILLGGGSEVLAAKKWARIKFNLPVKFGQLEIDPHLERRFSICAGLIKFFEKERKTPLNFSQKIKDFFKNLLP